MNTKILQTIESSYIKSQPEFNVGDTISVQLTIRNNKGEKRRSQTFKGLVIAMSGRGTGKMFTIRKISYGVGVEKIIPVHSPNIEKIDIIKRGKVRRSKIYYMRGRIGKSAMKVAEGMMDEAVAVEAVEDASPAESNETEQA